MHDRRHIRPRGGVLLEVILAMALFGFLIQTISVSGMSAFQAASMREHRAQALDLCVESLHKIENNPQRGVSSGTTTQHVTRHGLAFKVVQKTSELPNERLHTEIQVTWKTGSKEHILRRTRDFLLEAQ